MRFSFFFCSAFLFFGACSRCSQDKPAVVVDVDGGAAAAAAPANDGITAVLKSDGPPHPQAVRVCQALQGSVAARRAACCAPPNSAGSSGASSTEAACVSALTALLSGPATVDEQKLVACEKAQEARLSGCDWVRPLAPLPPPECSGLVTGSVDKGGKCRSSLECVAGLRCRGASPLDVGRCQEPGPDGFICAAAIDGAAIGIPQNDIDVAHPECASGHCTFGRCTPRAPVGGACRADAGCPVGGRCEGGKCVAGRLAEGAVGSRGGCADGLRCAKQKGQESGTCTALSPTGGACTADFDCRDGGCVGGVCGKKCSITAQ